jgi:hypothetical protein
MELISIFAVKEMLVLRMRLRLHKHLIFVLELRVVVQVVFLRLVHFNVVQLHLIASQSQLIRVRAF